MIEAMITVRNEQCFEKVPVKAYPIENDKGFELAVYHLNPGAKESKWVTFEQKTGLALHKAPTKKAAVNALLQWLEDEQHVADLNGCVENGVKLVDELIQASKAFAKKGE